MKTVKQLALKFLEQLRSGKAGAAYVGKKHSALFLEVLAREGITMARECLNQITDPDLREMVKTIFFSTCAGTLCGTVIGGAIAGLPGAQIGALIGTAVGMVTGCTALFIHVSSARGGLRISAG